MTALDVIDAEPQHAAAMAEVIHRAFAARPPLDPPAPALAENPESVAAAIAADGGLVVLRDGRAVGALLFDGSRAGVVGLRRVCVAPDAQGHGVASVLVGVAEDVAGQRGADGVWIHVREELAANVEFWRRRGYHRTGGDGVLAEYRKTLGLVTEVADADAAAALATRLAPLLQAGDLLVLSGGLGAGKTTFTQALGAALGVRGPITSPTFVLARSHPSLVGGPALVHVDAYRLGGAAEVDDLDLDASADKAVTVVEWGAGRAEQLSGSRLDVDFEVLDPAADTRRVTIRPVGPRWIGIPLRTTLHPSPELF